MRKIDPLGPGRCPEGYEYVHGYKDRTGTYVRPFCRKITRKRLNIKMSIDYPGNTKIKFSAKEGFHGKSGKISVPTESLFTGDNGKQLEDLLGQDWKEEGKKKKEGEDVL